MGLVKRFVAACVLGGAGTIAAAAGNSVNIANVHLDTGAPLPNGTYTNRNGVVTTPGKLPAAAYTIGRGGQKIPLYVAPPSVVNSFSQSSVCEIEPRFCVYSTQNQRFVEGTGDSARVQQSYGISGR